MPTPPLPTCARTRTDTKVGELRWLAWVLGSRAKGRGRHTRNPQRLWKVPSGVGGAGEGSSIRVDCLLLDPLLASSPVNLPKHPSPSRCELLYPRTVPARSPQNLSDSAMHSSLSLWGLGRGSGRMRRKSHLHHLHFHPRHYHRHQQPALFLTPLGAGAELTTVGATFSLAPSSSWGDRPINSMHKVLNVCLAFCSFSREQTGLR